MRLGTSPVPQVTVRQTADGVYRNWDADVDGKRCFLGLHRQSSTGATFPAIQLANPATSPVQLLLDALTVYSSNAGTLRIGYTTTLLATQYNAWHNKHLGEADGEGVFYGENIAGVVLTQLFNAPIAANGGIFKEWVRPILIDPGYQVIAYVDTVSTAMDMNCEGREV